MKTLCQLMNHGCFGCCGNNFEGKIEVYSGIKENTNELKKINNLSKFKSRLKKNEVKECGVCANLILKGKRMLCPLHPMQNNGEDIREGHCDINHLCKTAFHFKKWDTKTKNKFVRFVKSKKHDWYDFSINADNGKMLDEFLKI